MQFLRWLAEQWPPDNVFMWLTALFAALAASFFAGLTYRLNRALVTPVLTLHQTDQHTLIDNIGKGPALNTCLTDQRGRVRTFVGAVAAGESRLVDVTISFDIHEKYHLYFHDVQRGLLAEAKRRASEWKPPPDDIQQNDCRVVDDELLCAVKVECAGQLRAFGLVVIRREVLKSMPSDKRDLNDVAWQQFQKYFCSYQPDGPFVCVF